MFPAPPAAAHASAAPAYDNRPADAATAKSTDSATNPADIVVTATRRSERLQDVPLSVTAFTQADLTEKGIVSYEGIARQTPGGVLRSEELRVGQECVSGCRSRWSPEMCKKTHPRPFTRK